MKKTVLISILLIPAIVFAARSLNQNALRIKEKYPADYENTMKNHAVEKWGDDFRMVIYEINKQSDALTDLVDKFRAENMDIAFEAIRKFSIEGYQDSNLATLKHIRIWGNVWGIDKLIKLHCDWDKVKTEYTQQVKAKTVP